MSKSFVLNVNLRVQEVLGLQKVKEQLSTLQIGGIGGVGGGGLFNIQKQLKATGETASVLAAKVSKAEKAVSNLGGAVAKTRKKLKKASKSAETFGDQIFLAGKRYAAFLGATAIAFKTFQLIGDGTKAVIDFDSAMVALSQILETSVSQLGDLSQQFLDLSVSTGTSASEIADAAKLLAQAGFRGNQLTEAIGQLAKVPLTPIFEDMTQSVRGVIAALKQFDKEGLTVETLFDKLINVSDKFAASTPDLIEGLRRGGSAFSAIGGNLDEFLAAFTTIRAVTQESASSVGTSIKTLSSRLADPKIIAFLETKNIRLVEQGQFVGPLKAMRLIGEGLQKIKTIQEKTEIANKIGGRRQFSRFIALANNIKKLNKVLETSKNSFGVFDTVSTKGLQSISKQLDILSNKAKKLAIDLGSSLFVPFIQGITRAAEGAITLLDVLKPILPLALKIGTVFAGIGAIKAIGSLGSRLLGGLPGPTAFAAAGGGVGGAIKGIGSSPFVQAGLLIAASELAASFAKTSDNVDTFTSTLIRQTGTILAVIALLKKQTITQFASLGGLFPKLGKIGGAIASVGAIAIPLGIIEAQKSANELANKIITSTVDSIKQIEIRPTNPQDLQRGVGKLFNEIVKSVDDLVASTDIRKNTSIKGVALSVGKTLSNVFQGDFEAIIRRGGVTSGDVQAQVRTLLQKSSGIVNNIIDNIASSLVQSGADINTPDIAKNKLISTSLANGKTFSDAQKFANAIIESVGGIEAWNDKISTSAQAIQKETDVRQNNVKLMKIFIPKSLTGQLLKFSKAVDKTVQNVVSSNKLFQSKISDISGGIRAPDFSFDFSGKQIKNLINTGGLNDVFAFTPDIPKFVGGISSIEKLLDEFIINVGDTPKDISVADTVNKFFDSQKNLPQVVRDNFSQFFESIGKEIQAASGGNFIDIDTIKERFEKRFSNLGIEASDAVVKKVGQFLQITFAQIQNDANKLATVRQFELAAPVRPKTQAAFLEQQLRRVGIKAGTGGRQRGGGTIDELRLIRLERASRGSQSALQGILPQAPKGFFEGKGQRLADIAGDETIRKQVRNSFRRVIEESNALKDKLAQLKPGTEGFIAATQRARSLAKTTVELQTTLQALEQATSKALSTERDTLKLRQQAQFERQKSILSESVRKGEITPVQAQRKLFNLNQDQIQAQAALQDKFGAIIERDNTLRTELAQQISNTTETQADIINTFGTSVNVFRDITVSQTSTAELMRQNVVNFGKAVIDFTNLNTVPSLSSNEVSTQVSPSQVRSGEVAIPQGFDALNVLINDGNAQKQDMIDLLQSLIDKQDEIKNTQQEPVSKQENAPTASNDEKISQLTTSIDNLKVAIKTPSELKLITDQQIKLDLSTLPNDISDAVKPKLEEAATLAANIVLKKALESLASKSDSEVSIAVNNTAQELPV